MRGNRYVTRRLPTTGDRRLRIVLDDNETGIAADLLWIPRTASFAEDHQRSKRTPARSSSLQICA